MTSIDGNELIPQLPAVRGRYQANQLLADLTWFRVGGPAAVLFTPADEDDLAAFLAGTSRDIPIYTVGVGSNLLVRDGGFAGVIVRLGKGFADVVAEEGNRIRAGAAALDVRVARVAAEAGIDSLTFLRGIPGTIGGALRMNAGAYGGETKDIVVEARAVTREGKIKVLSLANLKYSYRHCGAPDDLIFTQALFQGKPGDRIAIAEAMEKITSSRESTQPVKSRTGGSTFKNPPGHKSWQLIDKAGMRGFAIGAAKVSEMHCNFLINEGGATAAQIEELGETVRQRVMALSGIELDWEIKRIGDALESA
jgi:UDP-N-acetylmuramate dehydrogenase